MVSGTGTVVAGDARFEGVRYTIGIQRSGFHAGGFGRLAFAKLRDAMAVFNQRFDLELADGTVVGLIATELTAPTPVLQVVTTGPVPPGPL